MVSARHIEWDSPDGDEARKLRIRVFVDEQKVPIEEEIDDIDPIAFHVVAIDTELGVVGTGRLFDQPEEPTIGRIGRMAVDARARGRNVGAALMKALITESIRRSHVKVMLDSQTHAIGFYSKFGFQVCGEEHMDCNIPHKMMEATRFQLRQWLELGSER